VNEWKTINTAPKDGSRILLWPIRRGRGAQFSSDAFVGLGRWHQPANSDYSGSWMVATGVYVTGEPTHWMPIPSPPQSVAAVDPVATSQHELSTRDEK
jgi:hypothetical protein